MCQNMGRCRDWIIAVRLGCLVILLTASLQKNWCHLIPSSVLRHHWSRSSILHASTLVMAQQSDPYRKIGRIQVLHSCNCNCHKQQEGQHPLTGQCDANFRLLANKWTERRLVTQWRHGCHSMRRSVCNTGASNGGRSLCVQISRERSYPLPIYWYHSKDNWLRYNFAADSFYIMKLCSRLFVLYCLNCPKDDKFRYLIPILTKLGEA